MQKTQMMHQPGRMTGNPPQFINRPYVGREDEFQKALAIYLKFSGAFWFHSPNGGSRNQIEAAKFKAMGVLPGVPDCMVLDGRHGFVGMAIEIKVKTNKPTENQVAVHKKLIASGWLVAVTWSLDDAIALVDWYFQ
jgi:hypothetical protein